MLGVVLTHDPIWMDSGSFGDRSRFPEVMKSRTDEEEWFRFVGGRLPFGENGKFGQVGRSRFVTGS